VKAVIGTGDDQFVRLTTWTAASLDGSGCQRNWPPARAPQPERTPQEDTTMQDTKTTDADIDTMAAAFAARVMELARGRTLRDAISLATTQDAEGAEGYRALGVGATVGTATEPAPVLSLSARSGESFDDLVSRYANEKGVPLRVAAHEVGRSRPDLAASR
jgi:hypothetical protein